MKISFDLYRVGRYAYRGSKVWRLGVHLFRINPGGFLIFRIVFLRTREHTWYWQMCVEGLIEKEYTTQG